MRFLVEIANDYRVLPHSRMHLPRPLGSSVHIGLRRSLTKDGVNNQELLSPPPQHPQEDIDPLREAYFSSVVALLTAELVTEKQAYAELKRSSDAQVLFPVPCSPDN